MSKLSISESSRQVRLSGGQVLELTTVRFMGRIEASTIARFQAVFDRLHGAGVKHVLVDMSGVEYITSTGLGGLVKYFNLFREGEGMLSLVGPPESVLNVIQMLELHKILPIFKDEAELEREYASRAAEAGGEELSAQQHLNVKRAEASVGSVGSARLAQRLPVVVAVPEENFFSMLLSDMLAGRGIESRVARNADDAFRLVAEGNAAAVMVDFLMPGYDDLCGRIKLTPEASTCSIIRLYQDGSSPDRVEELAILPNAHVVEPFPLDKLASLVQSEIERKRGESAYIQHELHFRFPSAIQWINKANKLMKKVLTRPFGEDRDAFLAITSSVREAIDNANRHGNKEDAAKSIDVIFILDREKATISVRDCGDGFDHAGHMNAIRGKNAADLAERRDFGALGGLGIALMMKCTDRLVYNARGNEVTQVKMLKPAAG